ncbi:LON peptidase substrate-binding domain-containing protein [Pulveribacter suum]|uniref:Peptidase S16 n=1 Tax=Pulveribacter suum TaxID=2116657 RepID=A0A2P1NJR1_9BURK|nr:LON peptidase substrate-binding domain-containing protein [Pulveribacter suum]AVP57266.1 peptidase S16 [Pulveribacter suum]
MSQALTLTSLPLFPLSTVLFPGGALQLRVFEVRYLDMVRKCRAAGAPFGVVALVGGSEVRRAGAPAEQLHEVGTLATIEQLDSPQPGLITLRCQGMQRFRITGKSRLPHGLWVADVQQLPPDMPVPVPQDLQHAAAALTQALASLRERGELPQPATHEAEQLHDCGWVANRWCELLPLPLALRQQLMALDNPLMRLELVSDVLERTGIAR